MRISENLLRSLIREMALAAISPMVTSKRGDDENRDSLKRYFSSKMWSQKATLAFQKIGIDVYLVPEFTETSFGKRANVITWQKALPVIEQSGLNVEELKSAVESGGTIIIAAAKQMVKNFWPSPWMLFHAFFDDQQSRETYFAETMGAYYTWYNQNIGENIERGVYSYDEFHRALLDSMTMRSAREKNINIDALDDTAAELITQSITTTKGCVIKHYENPRLEPEKVEAINDSLQALESFINGLDAVSIMENFFSGKIIRVNVENL